MVFPKFPRNLPACLCHRAYSNSALGMLVPLVGVERRLLTSWQDVLEAHKVAGAVGLGTKQWGRGRIWEYFGVQAQMYSSRNVNVLLSLNPKSFLRVEERLRAFFYTFFTTTSHIRTRWQLQCIISLPPTQPVKPRGQCTWDYSLVLMPEFVRCYPGIKPLNYLY